MSKIDDFGKKIGEFAEKAGDEAREFAKDEKTILVVGHNPGLEAFVQILTGQVETLPTASIAYIHAKEKDWKKITEQDDVTLKKLWRPKE